MYVANSSSDLLFDAIDKRKDNNYKPEVFSFCDYGTGDGIASMPLIYACIEKIKKTFGRKQTIHVLYEDQPANDFKQIFLMLKGMYNSTRYYSIIT